MGTNYYATIERCEHCNRSTEVHLGKASGGWRFSLHVTDDLPNIEAWSSVFKDGSGVDGKPPYIKDEYGRDVQWSEIVEWMNRTKDGRCHADVDRQAVRGDLCDYIHGEFS